MIFAHALEFQVNRRGLNKRIGWTFPGYLIGAGGSGEGRGGGGVLINVGNRKSKNHVFIVNAKKRV